MVHPSGVSIPRRAKRIDCVLLIPNCVVVIEFKCGAKVCDRQAIAQVEDYCLDLRDFHRASKAINIVPILVATAADPEAAVTLETVESVKPVLRSNQHELALRLEHCLAHYSTPDALPIDLQGWNDSEYVPTPTIVEAAQSLYAGNNVREIARSHAGAENLTRTTEAVLRLIKEPRVYNRKTICFITGVAGAGKTLAGLNIVHNRGIHQEKLGAFLSGNGPLVRVLSAASVSLRSYTAERLAVFLDALLEPNAVRAREIMAGLGEYPIVMTRSLLSARDWLRRRQRGTRRTGLVASSGARRLLAEGLDVTTDLAVDNWFLNPADDVRSSYFLEVPATEFGIQGLELDWVGLCWGSDLLPQGGRWLFRKFRGTSWQYVHDERARTYIVNKYRVLLTRAREGLVIWVPHEDSRDMTRDPTLYDAVAQYLTAAGVPNLDG